MLGLRPVTRGFTLLELLIVMAIVAIVATLAAPSFNGVLERQRVRTVADMLRSSIDLARSEAVKRNTPITVSRVSDDWNKGWQVLAGAEVVYEAPAQPSASITASHTNVQFTGNGRANASASFSIVPASGDTTHASCVEISLSGRPRSAKGEC